GAIRATPAGGHLWTWDPKETWAAATFLCYGLYLHLRIAFPKAETWAQVAQIAGFLLLQMCWYGLNFFPALGRSSLHIYN
ncbi:MAG: cytochrome c biogenesis protein CcsA, partial [Bacteroidales bacterium]|nr:cytochrome c biogenesis protein CcsA [Bacteroidales bacterium]